MASLRADAPVFVPTFVKPSTEQQQLDNQIYDSCNNFNSSNDKKPRNRRSRKKNQREPKKKGSTQSKKESGAADRPRRDHGSRNRRRHYGRKDNIDSRGGDDEGKKSSSRRNQRRQRGRGKRREQPNTLNKKDAVQSRPQDGNDESDEVKFEAYFPPLVETSDKTTTAENVTVKNALNEHYDGWSAVAWNAHAVQIQEEAMQKQEKQRQLASNGLAVLTPLQKATKREECAAEEDSANNDDSSNRDDTKDEPDQHHNETILYHNINNAGHLDMTKLRDRWWQLLREKRKRDAEQKRLALQQQSDEESSSDCDSESDSSTVLSASSPSGSECSHSSFCPSKEDDATEDGMTGLEAKLNDVYLQHPYPLHQAILNDDLSSIPKLLTEKDAATSINVQVGRRELGFNDSEPLLSADALSPLQLAVYLDKPHLVKALLDQGSFNKVPLVSFEDSENRTPLMLASELGLDGCVKVLLGNGMEVTTKDKITGNAAMHYVCKAGAPASTLRLLLGRKKGGAGSMQRLVSSKNSDGQTPLHVACYHGHVHLVEVFLALGGASLISKVLRIQDASGQTPLLAAVGAGHTNVVMALLMWKGNHLHADQQHWQPVRSIANRHNSKRKSSKVTRQSSLAVPSLCPLTWAVTKGSMDMVRLLLEFSDPSTAAAGGGVYDLVDALRAAVQSEHPQREEMVSLLVEAGANPCDSKENGNTPISMAACQGDSPVLIAMLDSFQNCRAASQRTRRQDPKLQRQPDCYFEAIERKENNEVNAALSDALVKSLFRGWRGHGSDCGMQCLGTSVALLKRGACMDQAAYSRLKRSIAANRLQPVNEVSSSAQGGMYLFEASYIHYGGLGSTISKKLTSYDRSCIRFWSDELCRMPWMKDEAEILCGWIKANTLVVQTKHGAEESVELGDVVLSAGDDHFHVHSELLSLKSAKLAAAIRFATMKRPPADNGPLQVHVNISPRMCRFLLQHIYHGSIVSGWATDNLMCCRDLLELSLVAEEFLCPSLLCECEMRLLAANPFKCYCWSCCTSLTSAKSLAETKMTLVECVYRVQGPSRLLCADIVLDVLAVSQQLGGPLNGSCGGMVKFICLDSVPSSQKDSDIVLWQKFNANEWNTAMPFEAAKEASLQIMLNDFATVLKSESYWSNMREMLQESRKAEHSPAQQQREAQGMLLQLCLDALAASPLLVKTKERVTTRVELEDKPKAK